MIDLLEDEDKFDNFMIPLTGKFFQKLSTLLITINFNIINFVKI